MRASYRKKEETPEFEAELQTFVDNYKAFVGRNIKRENLRTNKYEQAPETFEAARKSWRGDPDLFHHKEVFTLESLPHFN